MSGARSLILAPLLARTAGANGVSQPAALYGRFVVVCDITASATAAGDTLDVYVDFSLDGSKWFNAIHFTQQAGNGAPKTMVALLDTAAPGTAVIDVTSNAASGVVRPAVYGNWIRARWAIVDAGGHAQSHTFSIAALAQEG